MIQFTNTDEFLRIAATFMVKGIMVRHPDELPVISDTVAISLDSRYIKDLYNQLRSELASNLSGPASLSIKIKYLKQLHGMFSADPLNKWLPQIDKTRAELNCEISATNPRAVPMDKALRSVAVFQVQALCLMAIEDFATFTSKQKIWLGNCYLIATGGDWYINEVLREIERQTSLMVEDSVTASTNTRLSLEPKSTMSKQDYESLLYRRQLKALAHDQEMIEEYCFMEWHNRDDIDLWHGEREVEDSNGKKTLYFFKEYPKPHSALYLQHFIRQIMRTNSEDIQEWARKEFMNDIVDKDYVEKLLLEADDLGMSINNTLVIIHEGVIESYPPLPVGSPYAYSEDYPKFINQDAFYGGEEFRRKAEVLRQWCRETTSASASAACTIPLPKSNAVVSSTLPPRGNSVKGKQLLMNQLSDALDSKLQFNVQAIHAAELIFNTLHNDSMVDASDSFKILPNANARVFALANAFKLHKVITLPAPAIAALIGRALGIEVGKRLYQAGHTFTDCFDALKDAVLSMKTKAQARPNPSN